MVFAQLVRIYTNRRAEWIDFFSQCNRYEQVVKIKHC